MKLAGFELNHAFNVRALKDASQTEAVSELLSTYGGLVAGVYLEIVGQASDIEIQIGCDGRVLRIWGAARALEMNEAYDVQKYLPGSFALGDDEGGMALVLMNGLNGFGLYKVGFGDLDSGDAVYLAPSLDSLLLDGVGIGGI